MPTQLGFISGLVLLAAKRVEGTGTEQRGGPPLGRALAWPWPLAFKVRSGALGGTYEMRTQLIDSREIHGLGGLQEFWPIEIALHGAELL